MPATDERALPRLLRGIGGRAIAHLEEHLEVHGRLPDLQARSARQVTELVEASGLRGHGGASFPAAKKMRAVASHRGPAIVVANGCEGEPASKKDRVLLREVPHLVLDGAAVAARAVGAREAIVALQRNDARSMGALRLAMRDRRAGGLRDDPRFELFEIEPRYLAGQESALMSSLNGGPGNPSFTPPRPFDRGVIGRPTLVQNVETLAHLALIARKGADWFRELGTPRDPGSALVTVSGSVSAAGVYELEHGTPLDQLLEIAGCGEPLTAVLVGGYFGTWLPASELPRIALGGESLAGYGATLGAGVIVALDASVCPVAESSRIADFFLAESARQCGPCVNGLDAIADTVQQLASGTAGRGPSGPGSSRAS